MEQRARGIILRTRPLTETSLIVHWLTPDLGRVATVAKGARRPKSPFRGKLDLFFTADFTFVRSRRSDLHTLREVVLHHGRPVFRSHLGALQRACYATTFLETVSETETPLPELAAIVESFLNEVHRRPDHPEIVLAFELRMLTELGLAPNLADAPLTPGSRRIAGLLAEAPWESLDPLKPAPGQIRELRQFLHSFLLHQFGRLPRGRPAALEIIDDPVPAPQPGPRQDTGDEDCGLAGPSPRPPGPESPE